MTLRSANSCMFIGLPESGKSSFIGALWHVVLTGELNPSFLVTVQPSDRTYLNQLRSNFVNCVANDRTKLEGMKKIELNIKSAKTGAAVDFVFPDLDGEMYSSQFEYRQLTKEYAEGVASCQSLMLFINPDRIKKPYLIVQAQAIVANFDQMVLPVVQVDTTDNKNLNDQKENKSMTGLSSSAIDKDFEDSNEKEWIPKISQTQVILVDLLQMVFGRVQKPCKIGIIISAWDLIKSSADRALANITPDAWLQAHLPLLYQYLQTKVDVLPFKIFGVSAQGGEYSKAFNGNLGLQQKMLPSERLIVQIDTDISNDITVPLAWLFE